MSGGPEGGPMGPMGPNTMGPVLNGDGLDGMKNSPANGGPGTPREDSGSGMGDYNLGGFGGPGENVSINRFYWIVLFFFVLKWLLFGQSKLWNRKKKD